MNSYRSPLADWRPHLAALEIGSGGLFIPAPAGYTPRKTQPYLHSLLAHWKETMMFKWSVLQCREPAGVFVRKVGTW